jgi:hypothetical protein
MIIDRQTIVDALMTEPLSAGSIFDTDYNTRQNCSVQNSTCHVCAIGATLRKTLQGSQKPALSLQFWVDLFKNKEISSAGTIKHWLDKKDYLSALSVKFEKLAEQKSINLSFRKEMVKWVKKNLPNEFEFKVTI